MITKKYAKSYMHLSLYILIGLAALTFMQKLYEMIFK